MTVDTAPPTASPRRVRRNIPRGRRPLIALGVGVGVWFVAAFVLFVYFVADVSPPNWAETPGVIVVRLVDQVGAVDDADQVGTVYPCPDDRGRIHAQILAARQDLRSPYGLLPRFTPRLATVPAHIDPAQQTVTFTVQVGYDAGSGAHHAHSTGHPWTFTTNRKDSGWCVTEVIIPPMCEHYIRCTPIPPATPTPTPTPTPTKPATTGPAATATESGQTPITGPAIGPSIVGPVPDGTQPARSPR